MEDRTGAAKHDDASAPARRVWVVVWLAGAALLVLAGVAASWLVRLPRRAATADLSELLTTRTAAPAPASLVVVEVDGRTGLAELSLTPAAATSLATALALSAAVDGEPAELTEARTRFGHPLLAVPAACVWMSGRRALGLTSGTRFEYVILVHDPASGRAVLIFEYAYG